MKVLLVYNSVHGLTKEYAEWLQNNYSMDIVAEKNVKSEMFDLYDVFVFGGCVRFMKLPIAGIIKKNWDKLKSKEIILFSTQAMQKDHPMAMMPFYSSFEPKQRQKIVFFPFNGRLRQCEITPKEHKMIDEVEKNLKKMIAEGGEEENDYKILLNVLRIDTDNTDMEQLEAIIDYLSVIEKKYDDECVMYL